MFARQSLVSFVRFAALGVSFIALQACGPITTTASSKHEFGSPAGGLDQVRGAPPARDPVERLPYERSAFDRASSRDDSRSNESRAARFEVECRRCNR